MSKFGYTPSSIGPTEINGLTYRDILIRLNKMSDKQLDTVVICAGENTSHHIKKVWIVEEDQINPSGEGWEPISAYDDDENLEDYLEEITCYKGTPILLFE